jgi:hypothetical protein
MPLPFDLCDPVVLADPYPLYHALRRASPVWRGPQGQWVLTRYADVAAALHDPRLSSGSIDFGRAQAFPEPVRASVTAMMRPLQTFMVANDPPGHTRLRGVVNKALTPPCHCGPAADDPDSRGRPSRRHCRPGGPGDRPGTLRPTWLRRHCLIHACPVCPRAVRCVGRCVRSYVTDHIMKRALSEVRTLSGGCIPPQAEHFG